MTYPAGYILKPQVEEFRAMTCLLCERDGEENFSSLAGRALNFNGSAVLFNNNLTQRQPQAGTAVRAEAPVECVCHRVFVHAGAMVGYPYLRESIGYRVGEHNGRIVAVAVRIGDEVVENLENRIFDDADLNGRRGELQADPVVVFGTDRRAETADFFQHPVQIAERFLVLLFLTDRRELDLLRHVPGHRRL